MRARRGAALLAATVLALPLAACSDAQVNDKFQVVENPTAATAPRSPEPTTAPEGTVVGSGIGTVTALATDPVSRTLAVAVSEPAAVLLYDLDDPRAEPTSVTLPGPVEQLTVTDGTVLAPVPGANVLARIALPGGGLDTVTVAGGPVGAAVHDGTTLVALREAKAVAVVADGRVTRRIDGGLYSADDVLVADDRAVVLDRLRTALFLMDVENGEIDGGLRAGQGASNAVVDSFGRVLVTDTRRGGLLAFSTEPFLLRQRYPVPGGVYGLAYDPNRQLAWVTLTARNEVVGYDVRGGEPEEKYRYPTVRQPNSVTVDARTSRVIVGSAAGEGIQVITP